MVHGGLAPGLVGAHLHEPLGGAAVEPQLVDRLTGAHLAQLGRTVAAEHDSGTRASQASTTAGWRLAAAVPDVQVTATGRPLAFAIPSATKPAERSSITDTASIPACDAVSASGAFLDLGEVTAWRVPQRASSSTKAWIGA